MPALTKAELDESVAEWRRKMGFAAPERVNTKAAPASFATPAGVPPRDLQLIKDIAAGFAPTIQKQIQAEVAKALGPLVERIKSLEGAADGALRYQGVHQMAVAYQRGAAVTFDGGIWVATRATTAERPGSIDGGWQLAVKAGRAVTERSFASPAHPRNGSTPAPAKDRP
jgi:hypothetical protein